RVLSKVADRKDRFEYRLQARILAFRGQTVHLQEPLVRLLLNFNQVRNRDRGIDLREVDTFAVEVLRQAVHAFRSPLRPLSEPERKNTAGKTEASGARR